jgi:hypothetical protein
MLAKLFIISSVVAAAAAAVAVVVAYFPAILIWEVKFIHNYFKAIEASFKGFLKYQFPILHRTMAPAIQNLGPFWIF